MYCMKSDGTTHVESVPTLLLFNEKHFTKYKSPPFGEVWRGRGIGDFLLNKPRDPPHIPHIHKPRAILITLGLFLFPVPQVQVACQPEVAKVV